MPNHSSFVMFTIQRAPSSTSSRDRSGKMASKQTMQLNGPAALGNSTVPAPGVHSAWPSSIRPSQGNTRSKGMRSPNGTRWRLAQTGPIVPSTANSPPEL